MKNLASMELPVILCHKSGATEIVRVGGVLE
jgi:hypothetical protein